VPASGRVGRARGDSRNVWQSLTKIRSAKRFDASPGRTTEKGPSKPARKPKRSATPGSAPEARGGHERLTSVGCAKMRLALLRVAVLAAGCSSRQRRPGSRRGTRKRFAISRHWLATRSRWRVDAPRRRAVRRTRTVSYHDGRSRCRARRRSSMGIASSRRSSEGKESRERPTAFKSPRPAIMAQDSDGARARSPAPRGPGGEDQVVRNSVS